MKFHGYFIAFCTIFFTSVIIVSSFTGRDIHEEPFVIEEECELGLVWDRIVRSDRSKRMIMHRKMCKPDV